MFSVLSRISALRSCGFLGAPLLQAPSHCAQTCFSLCTEPLDYSYQPTKYCVGLVTPAFGATNDNYAKDLPSGVSAGEFMNSGKVVMGAASKDAEDLGKLSVEEYLGECEKAADAFCCSDELWDREDLKRALRRVFLKKGTLGLLVGGKSVHKTGVVQHFARNGIESDDTEPSPLFLYVNCRDRGVNISNLGGALLAAAAPYKELRQSLISRLASSLKEIEAGDLNHDMLMLSGMVDDDGEDGELDPFVPRTLPEYVNSVLKSTGTLKHILSAAKNIDRPIALMIDEANMALPGGSAEGIPHMNIDFGAVNDFLQMLVKETKEDNTFSVLLVSSEHAYPFRLIEAGLNSRDIETVIVAGEVPPHSMRELLRTKWKFGPRLTDLMMAHYGGHVHFTKVALRELVWFGDRFSPLGVRPVLNMTLSVRNALLKFPDCASLLPSLASDGFSRLPGSEDPTAEHLSKYNVGGVTEASCDVIGLWPEVIKEHGNMSIFLPSCQTMRICIDVAINDPYGKEKKTKLLFLVSRAMSKILRR